MIIDNTSAIVTPRTPRSGRWRVGLAGAGWVTHYHLPAWRTQERRAEVVAIADPDSTRLAERCAAHAIPSGYASVEAMLDAEDLDILDIAAPREAHAPLARLAAARGLAILCQKPLATSLSEADALVRAMAPGTRLMVHDNWRFRDTYRRIRGWLDEGRAGALRRVELHYVSSGMIAGPDGTRPALVRQPNFASIERLLVMEVLIHHLDTLRFLLGDLDLVDAQLARSNDAILGEDIATLTLRRRADGLPVELVGDLAMHGAPPQASDRLEIVGADATITLDGYELSLVGGSEVRESFDPAHVYQGSYDSAIAHFLDGLERGTRFETAPADNLETLALVEAAYGVADRFTASPPLRYARRH